MGLYRKQIGGKGEEQAESFLVRHGYRVLERNYHTPFGELDLIALDGTTLVFIEVKTRTSARYGSGLSAITVTKMNHMVKSALFFMGNRGYDDMDCRFDVIAVHVRANEDPSIKLIKNAFQIDQDTVH